MNPRFPKVTLSPPAGRPSWRGTKELPLVYLGWGMRDFRENPVDVHRDLGTNYYLILKGEVEVFAESGGTKMVKGPVLCLFDAECPFGIRQKSANAVEIVVWIWQGRPKEEALGLTEGGWLELPLAPKTLPGLIALHERCRAEVALGEAANPKALHALQTLLEIEICRAVVSGHEVKTKVDVLWQQACEWIASNLTLHAPVPALCDYLCISSNTLHGLFRTHVGMPPGAYFRQRKIREAQRLISECGWQVKEAAYHLGYRHPNDLSRALSAVTMQSSKRPTLPTRKAPHH